MGSAILGFVMHLFTQRLSLDIQYVRYCISHQPLKETTQAGAAFAVAEKLADMLKSEGVN
jgi:hypothetical protein